LPRWLDEGIAVYNEDPQQLVDDFAPIFDEAVKNNQLMSLRTLSSPFPADPMQANLAYGQSGAVVKFIVDSYGPDKMAKLLSTFAEGSLDDEALETALGVNTDGLDNAFRVSLGLPPLPGTADDAPAAATTEESADAAAQAAENVEPTQPSADNQASEAAPAPAQSAPAQPPAEPKGSPLGLPCLGGLLPFVALGIIIARRKAF
jgi:hypothetical protein